MVTSGVYPLLQIDVRFGSLADLLTDSSLMAAFRGKAAVHVGQF